MFDSRDQGGSSSLLDSVLASARSAREQLMKKHPDQMYGYLSRNQESGETSLNILNPDTCGTNKKVTVKISKKLEQGISPGDAVPKEVDNITCINVLGWVRAMMHPSICRPEILFLFPTLVPKKLCDLVGAGPKESLQ